MIDSFLIAQDTVVSGKGDTAAVDISGAGSRVFLLTLQISEIVEQESLDLSVYGSADGTTWTEKPVATFAQQFYPGEVPLLLNLKEQPEIKFVRAHWETNRWGRGPMETMFKVALRVREVPEEMLEEGAGFQKQRAKSSD